MACIGGGVAAAANIARARASRSAGAERSNDGFPMARSPRVDGKYKEGTRGSLRA